MKFKYTPLLNIILFAGLFVFGACSKATEDENIKTKAELITASTWKVSKASVNYGIGTLDGPGSITDNTVTFKSDKTGTIDEGPTKLDPTAPQTTTFNWSLSTDQSEIVISGAAIAGIGGNVKIVELTGTKFVLSKQTNSSEVPITLPITLPIAVPVTVTATLVH